MIKLVIFDLTNTCFALEETEYLPLFAKRHTIDLTELDAVYQHWIIKAETGEVTGEFAWQQIFKKFHVKNERIETVARELMKLKTPFADVLKIVSEVRKKYMTAYLTNYCKLHWDEFIVHNDLSKYFDGGIVSYQIGARKPSAKGFLVLMQQFGVEASQTVFIDDTAKNLTEAAALGIHTLHFTSVSELKKDLKKLRVL